MKPKVKILGFLFTLLILVVVVASAWRMACSGRGESLPIRSVAEVPRLPSHNQTDRREYDFPLGDGEIFKREGWDGQVFIISGRMTSDDFQKFLARFDLQNQLMHTKHGLEGLHINGEIAAGKYPNWVKSKYAEIAKDDDVVSFEGRKEDASISGIYSNNNNNIEFYLGY